MEPSPTFDASAPSPLRLTGFLITVVAALLAGVGATMTWVTRGLETAPNLDEAIKGTDLWEGKVVLVCAVAMLIAVLATRMAASAGARRLAAGVVVAAGVVTLAVATAFVLTASARFPAVESDALVSALAEASGIPPDQVAATLDETLDALGAFSRVGTGPILAIAGGLAGIVGGVLVLSWASRSQGSAEG